ncbi:MAG: DUF1566 domain-containing protein [Polyangia bacterium]|jgi:hypothetical protein
MSKTLAGIWSVLPIPLVALVPVLPPLATGCGRTPLDQVDTEASAAGASSDAAPTNPAVVFGMSCRDELDCPASSICCDGSSESCDGVRLPAGDGTSAGELTIEAGELTVSDTITGLLWQRDGSSARSGCSGSANLTCSRDEAEAYCASLSLSGVSGWRLPARMELMTILNLTAASGATIDQATFPSTPEGEFWTSSPYAASSDDAWGVSFAGTFPYSLVASGGAELRARCVRGSRCYPTSRFLVSDGLVTDTLTSLVWQQEESSAGMTWSDAQAYCATVGAGFRLPTAKELASLVDLTVTTGPTLDQTAFPDAAPEELWTSSLLAGSSDYAWSIFFYDGTSFLSDVSYTYRARCVR